MAGLTRTMFSSDVKQFKIRHVLIAIVVFAIGMGLVSSGQTLLIQWGALLLAAIVGVTLAYMALFTSDLIDIKRIDDRRLMSRFFNSIGLFIIAVTMLVLLVFGAIVFFQSLVWFLDFSLQYV